MDFENNVARFCFFKSNVFKVKGRLKEFEVTRPCALNASFLLVLLHKLLVQVDTVHLVHAVCDSEHHLLKHAQSVSVILRGFESAL
jgi:hypothetical protein